MTTNLPPLYTPPTTGTPPATTTTPAAPVYPVYPTYAGYQSYSWGIQGALHFVVKGQSVTILGGSFADKPPCCLGIRSTSGLVMRLVGQFNSPVTITAGNPLAIAANELLLTTSPTAT
jgi:hypothetical protein